MKLLTFVTSDGPRLVDLHEAARLTRSRDVSRIPRSTIHHAPVVPAPGKTICLGLNYSDHTAEGGRDRPDYPWLFFRGATSLVGHGERCSRRC